MLKLSEKLRIELKKPYGRIFTNVEEVHPTACVGDVVSYTFLSHGIKPKIIIFDGKSERKNFEKFEELIKLSSNYLGIEAENPPSTITSDVVSKIGKAVRLAENGSKVKIFVRGEEDLTLIPLLCALKIGSTVVYGQPGEGMVEVKVTREKKLLILQLLEQMERVVHDGKNGREIIEKCRRWANGSIR